MQKYENNFRKRYKILKMFTKHANNWVFRNIIPFIDNHKIRSNILLVLCIRLFQFLIIFILKGLYATCHRGI